MSQKKTSKKSSPPTGTEQQPDSSSSPPASDEDATPNPPPATNSKRKRPPRQSTPNKDSNLQPLHKPNDLTFQHVIQWTFGGGTDPEKASWSRMTSFGRVTSNAASAQTTTSDGTHRVDATLSNTSKTNQDAAIGNATEAVVQHPRTGARLFLLIHYSHHLALQQDPNFPALPPTICLTSRTYRRIRKFTKPELRAMLKHEETEFVKDLYLRKHKFQTSEREELWVQMAAHPMVRWALDFDVRELENLFAAAQSGRIPVESQLEKKYRRIQSSGEAGDAASLRNSTTGKKKTSANRAAFQKTPGIRNTASSSVRSDSTFRRSKASRLILKRGKSESAHSFIQRIIENERTRRINVLSQAHPDLGQLRDPKLFERRVATNTQEPVHDSETLSDFRALSKRLQNTFKIADVGDKKAALHSTQNIKLMRVEKKVVGKLDWDKTCCLKGTTPGSYVKSRNFNGMAGMSGISESMNRFLSSMDDLYRRL